MGFTLLKKAFTLASLLATLILSSACSEKLPEENEEAEVKSINIFFSKEQEAGADVGKAYSFSPDSGRITEIATINSTPDSIAVLDTDEDAPGYEFAAYAEGKTLKLIDYSKTATKRIYELETYSADICGVFASKIPSKDVFEFGAKYKGRTIDDTSIFVALSNSSACDRETNTYRWVDFDLDQGNLLDRENKVRESRTVYSDEVFKAFLVDPTFVRKNEKTGEVTTGRVISIGHSKESKALVIKDELGNTLTQAQLDYAASPPFIIQATNERVLIQRDLDVFVIELNKLKELLETPDSISGKNALEAFLTIPVATLSLASPTEKIEVSNQNAWAYKDDSGIFVVQPNKQVARKVYTSSANAVDINFSLTSSTSLLVHEVFSGHQTLSELIFPSDSDPVSSNPIILNAEKIDFRNDKRDIYINVFDTVSLSGTTISGSSNIAAHVNAGRLQKVFNNAAFIYAQTLDVDPSELLILSSKTATPQGEIEKPSLYKFDPNESSGFLTTRSDGSELDINFLRYGVINGNISFLEQSKGSSFKSNAEFGLFQVLQDSIHKGYFYKPKQADKKSEDPSLTLIKTEADSSNLPAVNAITTSNQDASLNIDLSL